MAEDYDRVRPGPPVDAVNWLVPVHCEIAVDLGAGTGLFTRALARRAAHVIAVEPDARMRAVLATRSSGVRVVGGWGEAIPLPDANADGLFVSSAWHWLDPERAVPEIGRVLRDGGRLGVIWTGRDRDVDWVRDLDRLGTPAATGSEDAAWFETAAGTPRRPRHDVTLRQVGLFENIVSTSFGFSRTMTIGHIVDMLGTYSGLITATAEERAAGLARAGSALQERSAGAGTIDMPMRAWCWREDRAKRTGRPVSATP
jgi:SAM-dependent methyltransferase